MNIGETIKSERKKKNLTQKELAEKIDKSERMVQKYESGNVTPSIDVLNKIGVALGVFIFNFTDGENIENQNLKEAKNAKEYERLYNKLRYTLEEFEFYSPEYEKQNEDYFDEVSIIITDKDENDVVTTAQSTYVDLGQKMFSDIEKYKEMRILYFLEELKRENEK